MDCEKFDRIVLELLEGELDELTSAAAKRHMEHCTRCRGIAAELRATLEVGKLPLVEPPAGLERRILEAEQRATQLLPIGKRLGRGLSLLAGYAMRPQLAMAALLMLMIGSSLLFLRTQPGDREQAGVTERGVPESDGDQVSVMAKKGEADSARLAPRSPQAMPAATAPELARRERAAEAKPAARAAGGPSAPMAAPGFDQPSEGIGASSDDKGSNQDLEGSGQAAADGDASYEAAMAAYRDGRYSEAERRFAEIATQGGEHAPSAALYEVQALRMVSGCPAAAPRFEGVHTRYPGSVGNDAAWQAADCYRALGDLARARRNYEQLATDASYKARAKEALTELDQRLADQEAAARKANSAAAAAAAPASPPAKAKATAPAKPAKPSATTD